MIHFHHSTILVAAPFPLLFFPPPFKFLSKTPCDDKGNRIRVINVRNFMVEYNLLIARRQFLIL